MSGPYDDIIHLPHHVSPSRPRMPLIDRAAQFSPFAALSGHDAAVQETARLTDQKKILDEDTRTELDRKQAFLMEHISERPELSVTYFVQDDKKEGGAYVTATGHLKRIDPVSHTMIFTDGTMIDFVDVTALDSPLLEHLSYD